ncbi:HAD family hydrolase [Simiduia agarivorans]|uniref:phosphoserine phosphatase n=1 Tax=Simiduia agarivorans (strain DSM 21679 / JCM 13881 / BCRC 17597 / SA1) TaxID=1117647 RepID=K4L263_SIMAS|nr:HAD family hydrolase [Simiduia agarivorans]AFV00253.1 nonspecific acid phosphatase [Simiduia agarivorans SA1 = DSM 21679]
MKTRISAMLVLLVFFVSLGCKPQDPLPSWHDGNTKQAITDFVTKTTQKGAATYVPEKDRIAVFDNDGTLWSETPLYFQAFYIFDQIRIMAPQHPEWQNQEPFASVLRGDLESALAGGEKALIEMMMATHSGMSTDEFRASVSQWISSAKHPATGKLYTAMVFQPMLELMNYLRANGFTVYIVSGGGVDFMRAWTERVYGVAPPQVIGSRIATQFVMQGNTPVLMREPALEFVNDKGGKPVAIHHIIGQRPLMAFGNSDGDLAMLQWTSAGNGPRFAAIVHHTDNARESAYDRKSHVGKLDQALDLIEPNGWTRIDMKQDWKRVYPD